MLVDDEEDDVERIPRGLVNERRAFFGVGENRLRTSSVPPSPSVGSAPTERRARSSSRLSHVNVIRYGVSGPAQLLNATPDETDISDSRRVTVTRQVTTRIEGEPRIIIERSSHSSTMAERPNNYLRSHTRTFPTVTINLSDPPHAPQNSITHSERTLDPPKDYAFTPIEIPVQRSFSSTPIRPNTNRTIQLERIDICSKTNNNLAKKENNFTDVKAKTPSITKSISIESAMSEESEPMDLQEQIHELNASRAAVRRLTTDLQRLEQVKLELESELHESQDHKRTVSHNQIVADCTRMLAELREHEEKENRLSLQINGRTNGSFVKSLWKEVDKTSDMGVEMPPPATVLNNKQDLSNRSSDIPATDTSHIISLKDQSVMYTTGAMARQEALISRLQKELTDAQRCNHALNTQLGAFRSTDNNSQMKKELTDTKKELKERQNECDQLRRLVQKSERDRQLWEKKKTTLESKLPVDVQLLMAQKRELTTQLDREQSEKQELFLQINTLIAQLAESGDGVGLREENKILKRKLDEQEALTTAESKRLTGELQKSREQLDIETQTLRLEKKKLQADVEETRKELNMKSAALQSLMLAKQDNSKEDNKRLIQELEDSRQLLRNAEEQVMKKEQEIRQLAQSDSQIKARFTELENKLITSDEILQREKRRAIELEQAKLEVEEKLRESESLIKQVHVQLQQTENGIQIEKQGRHQQEQVRDEELRAIRAEIFEITQERNELSERVAVLQATLQEKDGKIDATKVALLAAESRAAQAEEDRRTSDNQIKNAERRLQQLQAQLDTVGNEGKEVELLREELKKSEERFNLVQGRLQKTESSIQTTTEAHRNQLDELQTRINELENELGQVDTLQEKIKVHQEEIHELNEEKKKNLAIISKLENELDDSKKSKISVADEITTLMSSLSAVRSENGQYQDEISSLEQELGELREEFEQITEEVNEWRHRAETLQKEKESIENEMETDREKVTLLNSLSDSNKDELSKLETVNKQLQNQLTDLQKEHSNLKTALEQSQSEIATIKKQAADEKLVLQKSLDTLSEEKKTIEHELNSQLKVVNLELQTTRERASTLEEERTRVVGSSDEEKKRLLEESNVHRQKAETASSELKILEEKYKFTSSSLDSEKAKSAQLEERLIQVEKNLESALSEASTSSQAYDQIKEIQASNASLKQQLEELEDEKKEFIVESSVKQELLEKQIFELKANREVVEKQQRDLEERLEDVEKMEKKIVDLEAKLLASNKLQQEYLLNLKNMTELLETESKRVEESAQEKRRWKEKAEESERLLAEAENSPKENDSALIAENARLAGELLKTRSQGEQTLEIERRQYEDKLASVTKECSDLSSQIDTFRARVDELNRTIVQTEKKRKDEVAAVYNEMEMVKNERARLQTRIDDLYNHPPTAPPRRISNMSAVTNFSMNDFSEIEDVEILRKEIDRLKRLVIVLRRKLQGLQLQ